MHHPSTQFDLHQVKFVINKCSSVNQTIRNHFKNIKKGFEEKELLLAQALKRVEVLESKVAASQTVKRRKIESEF